MFSKACEYGIRAAIHIGQQSSEGKRASLKAVASAIDSPEAFTAKILQSLAKADIIESIMGPTGGYQLSPEKGEATSLLKIVNAIDGEKVYEGCGLGLKECNEAKPCPVHYQFASIRNALKSMLETTSIRDLTKGIQEEMFFLK